MTSCPPQQSSQHATIVQNNLQPHNLATYLTTPPPDPPKQATFHIAQPYDNNKLQSATNYNNRTTNQQTYSHYEKLPSRVVTVHRPLDKHLSQPVPVLGPVPPDRTIMATDIRTVDLRARKDDEYEDSFYDLDLHYITERIIAMSFPTEGQEAAYRNNMRDLAKMLQTKHGHNYLVLNLSERRNDLTLYNKKVLEYGWPEDLAPPLERLCSLCKEIDSWLNSDPQRVVVLHCKGKKGRTGVVIAAFMHYCNICASADQALDRFAMKRFYEDKIGKISQPSQKRYVHYFAGLLSGAIKINSSPLFLHQIILHGVPTFDDRTNGCRPFIKIYLAMEPVHTSGVYNFTDGMPRICFNVEPGLQLRGDVMIKAYHKRPHQQARDVIFRTQFHTCAISQFGYTLTKAELDDACTDRRFPDKGKVELLFSSGPQKQGPHFYHDPPPLLVDDSRDTIVRWDSYSDFSKLQNAPKENGEVNGSDLSADRHVQGPLDGSLYATVTKQRTVSSSAALPVNNPVSPDLTDMLHNSIDSGISNSSTSGVTGVSVSVITSQPTQQHTSYTSSTSTSTSRHTRATGSPRNQLSSVRSESRSPRNDQQELDAVLNDLLSNDAMITSPNTRKVTSYSSYEAKSSTDKGGYVKRSYQYTDSADPSKNVSRSEIDNVDALTRLLALPAGYRQSPKADALDLALPENGHTWLEEQQRKLRKPHSRPRTEQERKLVEELKTAQDKFISKQERSNFFTYVDDQSGYMSEPEGSNYRNKRYSKGLEPSNVQYSTTLVTDMHRPPASQRSMSPAVPSRSSSRDAMTRSRSLTRGEWTSHSKPLHRQNSDLSHDRYNRSSASPPQRPQSPLNYRPTILSASSTLDRSDLSEPRTVTESRSTSFTYEPRVYSEQRVLMKNPPKQYDSLPRYSHKEVTTDYKDRLDGPTDDPLIYSHEDLENALRQLEDLQSLTVDDTEATPAKDLNNSFVTTSTKTIKHHRDKSEPDASGKQYNSLGERLEELERSLQAAQNAISAEAALRRDKEAREAREKAEREAQEARERMERDARDADRLRQERDIIQREIREREIIQIREKEAHDDTERLLREKRELERLKELERRERELLEKERQLKALEAPKTDEVDHSGTRTITRTYMVEPSRQALDDFKVKAKRRRSSVEDVYLLKPIGVHTLETDETDEGPHIRAASTPIDARSPSATMDSRSGTLDHRSATLDSRSGTLDHRSATLDSRSGMLDSRSATLPAEPVTPPFPVSPPPTPYDNDKGGGRKVVEATVHHQFSGGDPNAGFGGGGGQSGEMGHYATIGPIGHHGGSQGGLVASQFGGPIGGYMGPQKIMKVHKTETTRVESPQPPSVAQHRHAESQRVEGRRFDGHSELSPRHGDQFEVTTITKEHQEHGPEVFVESGGSSLNQSFETSSAGGNYSYESRGGAAGSSARPGAAQEHYSRSTTVTQEASPAQFSGGSYSYSHESRSAAGGGSSQQLGRSSSSDGQQYSRSTAVTQESSPAQFSGGSYSYSHESRSAAGGGSSQPLGRSSSSDGQQYSRSTAVTQESSPAQFSGGSYSYSHESRSAAGGGSSQPFGRSSSSDGQQYSRSTAVTQEASPAQFSGGSYSYSHESRSAGGSSSSQPLARSSSSDGQQYSRTTTVTQDAGPAQFSAGSYSYESRSGGASGGSAAHSSGEQQFSGGSYSYSNQARHTSTGGQASRESPLQFDNNQRSVFYSSSSQGDKQEGQQQQYSWSEGARMNQSYGISSDQNQSWSEGYAHGEGAHAEGYSWGSQNGGQSPPTLMVDTSHTRNNSSLSSNSQFSPASPNTLNQLRSQLSKDNSGNFLSPNRQGSPSTSTYTGMSRQASMQSLAFIDTVDMINLTPKFVKDLSKYWYKPNISRDEAIQLLKDKSEGTFVVRDSNSFPGAFGLALKVASLPPNVQSKGDPETELVRHFLIESTPKGVRMKGCNNEPVFASLSTLVYQHTITPLALPCKLVLPECSQSDLDDTDSKELVPGSAEALLAQGAACNVLYINSVDTELLTGPQALARAMAETKNIQPKTTEVHFKVSGQGVTLTDNLRKLFFRRHYPVNTVTYCGMDPDDTRWLTKPDNGKEISAKVFGFVARKPGSQTDNCCHIFAELDPEQPASAIVNFVTKVMIGSQAAKKS